MFLQDVPVNALLICYGPLILTILGFVLFAVLTDRNARRTYLRRSLGPQDKRLAEQVRTRKRPLTVETPAGSVMTVQPLAPSSTPTLPGGGAPVLVAGSESPAPEVTESSTPENGNTVADEPS
jgi:hypothetical protein